MMSLARGLLVIQAFTQTTRQLTISQLSGKTGLSRAAVRRCLYTLAQLGFAASDDPRHFYLSPRVLALGYSYMASMPLAAAAQPVLERVSHELHESCSISTLDRTDIVVERLFASNIRPVLGVRDQLTQVFVNLFTNACHAMQDGKGRLSIQTELDMKTRAVRVRVSDTGHCIGEGVS